MRWLVIPALTLWACASATHGPAAGSAADDVSVHGSVVARASGDHLLVVAVDADDPAGRGDGVADHLFRFWSNDRIAGLNVSTGPSVVEYHDGSLIITNDNQHTQALFVVAGNDPASPAPPGFTRSHYAGYGLSHRTGEAVRRIRLGSNGSIDCGDSAPCPLNEDLPQSCDAGGNGAAHAAVGGRSDFASVSCAPGYYACCSEGHDCACRQ